MRTSRASLRNAALIAGSNSSAGHGDVQLDRVVLELLDRGLHRAAHGTCWVAVASAPAAYPRSVLGAEMVRLPDPSISFGSILVIAVGRVPRADPRQPRAEAPPSRGRARDRHRHRRRAVRARDGSSSTFPSRSCHCSDSRSCCSSRAWRSTRPGCAGAWRRSRSRSSCRSSLAVACAFALQPVEAIRNPLFVAIILASTSLGLIVPVVRDAGEIDDEFGQVVLACVVARGVRHDPPRLPLLLDELVGLIGLRVEDRPARRLRRARRSSSAWRCSRPAGRCGSPTTLRALEDTSAQLGVRIAILLLVGFVALAGELGIETILGAFIAGALLRVVDPEAHVTHVEFRRKVEAIGYGFLIPMFFVSSGARFDVDALDPLPRPPRPHPAVPDRAAPRPRRAGGPLPALLPEPEGRCRGAAPGDVAHVHRRRGPPRPRARRVRRGVGRVPRRRRPPLRHRLPAARALAARRRRRGRQADDGTGCGTLGGAAPSGPG